MGLFYPVDLILELIGLAPAPVLLCLELN